MAKILLVFGSTEGHTEQIANRLAAVMRESGHSVDLYDSNAVRRNTFDGGYDGAIVGGSVHIGAFQSSLREFVRLNRAMLERVPSAFFSVSLSAAEADEEGRQETQAAVDKFVRETGWQPGRVEIMAGALVYTQYDFFTRLIMKLISKNEGRPTNTSRDYDYTDWAAVEAFARDFAAGLATTSRAA